jgi:hypothetical protein
VSDELGEDQPRFLGNVIGYSRSPGGGLRGEPEALTEAEQRALTEAAHRRALEERIRTRQASAGRSPASWSTSTPRSLLGASSGA